MPKSYLYKAVRNKKIKVNRRRCEISQRLNEGDSVLLFIDPRFLQAPQDKRDFLQVPAALDVIYEDDNILVIDKPRGAALPKRCARRAGLRGEPHPPLSV